MCVLTAYHACVLTGRSASLSERVPRVLSVIPAESTADLNGVDFAHSLPCLVRTIVKLDPAIEGSTSVHQTHILKGIYLDGLRTILGF